MTSKGLPEDTIKPRHLGWARVRQEKGKGVESQKGKDA